MEEEFRWRGLGPWLIECCRVAMVLTESDQAKQRSRRELGMSLGWYILGHRGNDGRCGGAADET